ncbi:AraC family transcriptional regulator [Marivirga sp. S37H4]|uniref:AraC family transcriptional regulator n=1 Tax=Marivirga aurantiaca TaxID=2802615 RepID=A0A934X0D7_9BACT|nr:helix-turn-helix domain-containing protein [Marivirga aurantiaca]MBK6266196.1 AraC family transcriptional regulator [Marivirga aurantiaca]
MKNQFSLFDLLMLIGITQGVITSILLMVSTKNSLSNRFLAFAILSFCLLSVKILLHTLGLWETTSFRYFPIGIELAIAPLVYFYVKSLTTPAFKFKWKDSLHFIPFILSQTYAFFVYFKISGIPALDHKDLVADSLGFYPIKKTEDYLVLLSIFGYLILGFLRLQKYRKWLNDNISDNTFPNFNWLTGIFVLSTVLGLFLFVNLSLDQLFDFNPVYSIHWEAYFIFIAFLIYYLGFVGYQQPDFQMEEIEKTTIIPNPVKLSEEKAAQVIKGLEEALQKDKVFLNPKINSQELAKILEISQSHLSYVVNRSFKKSFRDLINDYRIEEVKSKLKDTKHQHKSILGIALECGFNSEASFYRIFKTNTGMTPKEYILQVNKN